MSRRLACLVCTVWWLAALASPGLAGNQTIGLARLETPDAVGEGLPFLVRVESQAPFTQAVLRWQGRSLTLYPETTPSPQGGQRFQAVALLGLGLLPPPSPEAPEAFAADEHSLEMDLATLAGPAAFRATIRRLPRSFPAQDLDVPDRYVSLSKADQERHQREKRQVEEALATMSAHRFWECPLFRPLRGGVSGAFGERRFYDEQPRQPHRGVDLRGKHGQPVSVCFAGRVLLTADHLFSGRTVFVDHGEGVVSMYMHLSEIMVSQGQRLSRGQTVGRVGATGRVTGPHLHFGLALWGHLVDPLAVNSHACGLPETASDAED